MFRFYMGTCFCARAMKEHDQVGRYWPNHPFGSLIDFFLILYHYFPSLRWVLSQKWIFDQDIDKDVPFFLR